MNTPMNLPAIPYVKILRQFAEAKGLRFVTWADINKTASLYLEYAKYKN